MQIEDAVISLGIHGTGFNGSSGICGHLVQVTDGHEHQLGAQRAVSRCSKAVLGNSGNLNGQISKRVDNVVNVGNTLRRVRVGTRRLGLTNFLGNVDNLIENVAKILLAYGRDSLRRSESDENGENNGDKPDKKTREKIPRKLLPFSLSLSLTTKEQRMRLVSNAPTHFIRLEA